MLLDRQAFAAGADALDMPNGDPVLLAVRNDDLRGIIAAVPVHRRHDLVFLQNGAIRELLTEHGLGGASRGLLYVLAASRDADLVVGGRSVFGGPHGAEVARWFGSLGVSSESTDPARFALFELEKLLWLAIMGPLCESFSMSVGDVAADHREDIAALVRELAPVLRATWGVDPDHEWLVGRIVAYSSAIAGYRASVKEWPWRNGWLQQHARRLKMPTERHDALLTALVSPRFGA